MKGENEMSEIKNQAEQEALAKRLSEMKPEEVEKAMPNLYGFLCGFQAGRESAKKELESQPA